MATTSFVQTTAPTVAAGLKVGDIWLDLAGTHTLKICVEIAPAVRFITIAEASVVPAAIADETTAVPAGGTGAAAGGWDTAANRNTAITTMNNIRTKLNSVLAALRAANIITT